jgi:hypothetical protein
MNFDVNRLALALSPSCEPGAHRFRQAIRLNAETRFDKAFGKWERVIKLSLAREVAHAKVVQPIEGARTAFGTYNDFDLQLPSKHEASIALRLE